jgi:hypothetical protein
MGGVVNDIVNPIGAITGVDPVKSATGFTGTGFEPKTSTSSSGGQQQTASGSGGGSSGGNGGMTLAAVSGQMLGQQQQQVAQSNNMFGQFGQQLSQLSNQIAAPPVTANPAPTQSATDLAAQITASSVHAAQTAPPGHQPQQQPFWQMSPTMNTRQ